ncbi:MAG: choice-of-anchor J domain-containing protein [Flavobacteriales bacterium]
MKYVLIVLIPCFLFAQEPFFKETFDQMSFGSFFDQNWTVKNIQGENSWRVSSHKKSTTGLYAKISGYKGSENEEDWLVLKKDLSSCYKASLEFETATGYYKHNGLSIWIHDTENIMEKGKKVEKVNLASKKDLKKYNFSPFVSSGKIDISEFCGGMFYVGFRYLGNNSNESTTFELDNVQISIK